MVRKKLVLIILLYIPSLFVGPWGCQSDNSADSAALSGAFKIVVEPSESVTVGYFEKQTFVIKLQDAQGTPLVGDLVTASFEGVAHNAHLEPVSFVTDAQGAGEVVFTAPDKDVGFDIRFSSPAVEEDTLVGIEVSHETIALSLNVTYSGKRQIGTVDVELYRGVDCESLTAGSDHEPVKSITESPLPASLNFTGLYYNETYTAWAVGRDANGEVCAKACLDDLVPNLGPEKIALSDVVLNISGNYEITTEIETDGALDVVVNNYASYFNRFFVNDPARSILNGIGRVISAQEPVAAESYEELREQNELEAVLNKYLEKNAIDLPALFEPVWESVKDHLVTITARGALELVSPDDGDYPVFHRIDQFDFLAGDGENISIYWIEGSENGMSVARLDENDDTRLIIDKHQIALGLATPILFLLFEELDARFKVQKINVALESIVDCEQVADQLVPWLKNVSDRILIHAGCIEATLQAEQKALERSVLLNTIYSQLAFIGSCQLEEPVTGNRTQRLIEGVFHVTWTGFTPSPIGPMDATFEAQLSNTQ